MELRERGKGKENDRTSVISHNRGKGDQWKELNGPK
jgi:hypothetical protein